MGKIKQITLEDFLRQNKKLFSIVEIERRLSIPSRTLQRVLNGKKAPKKYREPIINLLYEITNDINIY